MTHPVPTNDDEARARRRARTICQEAHERLVAREEAEGDLVDAMRRVAEQVSRRTGALVTADLMLWCQVELGLERARRRPAEPAHLRDVAASLALLAKVRAADAADAWGRTGAWNARRGS